MMGVTHALSGGVVWLAGCATVAAAGGPVDPVAVVVGTPVAAGWALWPDLDHPDSTLTHRVGRFGGLVSAAVATVGRELHAVTRTPWDRPNHSGHRALTHTLSWAVLTGLLVAAAARWLGLPVAALLVFTAAYLGTQVVVPWRVRRFRLRVPRNPFQVYRVTVSVPLLVAATAATILVAATAGGASSWWWLGIATAVGSLTHCLGDVPSGGGCPVFGLMPVPVLRRDRDGRWRLLGWRMWARLRTPQRITIRLPHRSLSLPGRLTLNGWGERLVLRPLLWLAGFALFSDLIWPTVHAAATRVGGVFVDVWSSVLG